MKKITLRDYISIKKFSGELTHQEIWAETASVEELSIDTFSEVGLEKWKRVLDMTIEEFQNVHGEETLVLNGGADCEKETALIEEFTYALAGYINHALYRKWFTKGDSVHMDTKGNN